MDSLLKSYESWVKMSKSPVTAKSYIRDVRNFYKHLNKSLEEVTPLDVTEYFSKLEKNGVKPRSINRYAWALRSFFEAIGKTDLARLIPTPVYEAPLPKWLDKKRVYAIIEAAEDGLPKTLLATAYDLALRQTEVTLLNRRWFNGENMTVKRLKRKGAAPAEATLPVSKWVAELLDDYLSSRNDVCEALFAVKYGGGYKRISPRTVNYIYRKAAFEAGVSPDEYSFHSFSRHSRATHLAIEMIEKHGSADVLRLAKFLGHVSTNSTLLYIHLATTYLSKR